MIRVTGNQAKLLFGSKPVGQRKPRVQKRREDLPENQVEHQILDYLHLHGWIVERRHVGTFIPYYHAIEMTKGRPLNHRSVVRIGEKGEPDWFVFRRSLGHTGASDLTSGDLDAFWLETKAPGGRLSAEQAAWIAGRRALGFIAVWFDSFDAFARWYADEWG